MQAPDWKEITVPGRKDIIGIRDLEDGRREFLMHNRAFTRAYYVTIDGSSLPGAEVQTAAPNRYDKSKPLRDLEGWILFYGNQAQDIHNDPDMSEVFRIYCETAELLLELQELRGTK